MYADVLLLYRADEAQTQENYSVGNVKQYNGVDSKYLYSSKEEAYQHIEAFKASIAQEGDTYDEYVNLAPQPQASVCIIDQSNGHIKAMVGGRGEKTTNRGLNRAYGTTRQAGSCFKILAVYAPALDSAVKDNSLFSPATMLCPLPLMISGGSVDIVLSFSPRT